nr:hypothetical protein [Tanacetum cinerariifolium]
MLRELKTLFAQQAKQKLLQTMRDFHSCRQEEGQSVSSYVLKMKGHIDNLERLGHPMTLGLGVSLILISLRKEYDGFVHNYNMHNMGKTINELHAMLKLHKQTLHKSNAPALNAIRYGKVQKGHWKRNCPRYLAELLKKKKNAASGAGGSGYPKETMGYSFYYPPKNKILVARNAEFLENSLINHEASGSLEYLEIIQEEDMHPSIDTSLNHEEDDLEIYEPQNPESKKWLNAMNVEMQSMKDNEVWVLVELPPNGKTVGSKWLFKKKTDMDGNVHIYKARLVAKGYTQTLRIDYEETFSPVADIRAIRILIAIAAYYDSEIWQLDVKTAFLNGYLNEEVYMEQPKGFVNPKPAELKRMQNVSYASAVGSIMYVVRCTRPDVVFAHNVTSRFQQNSGFLATLMLDILTDADDLKSQTGYVFVLNGGAVDWKTAKQSIFATSSAEAEYIATFDASKEAVWVRKFIFRLDDNLADHFIKALAFLKHSEHTRNIGMLPASGLM